jgi:hypothetical protein
MFFLHCEILNFESQGSDNPRVVQLTTSFNADQKHNLASTCTYANSSVPHALSRNTSRKSKTNRSKVCGLATPSSSASVPSPGTTDLELTKSGTGFKDSTHWTFVLEGALDINGHDISTYAIQSEAAFERDSPAAIRNVLLFEGCDHATDQEILDSMPSKVECDRLVALYFRTQEYRCEFY